MTTDFTVNITSLASLVVAVIAILTFARNIRLSVLQMRDNDLKHIDAKLDAINKRIDDVYKLIAEKRI